ncbi:DedA family protein [Phenylobacterium sp.]|uniref:DedA family protein n=1 Tax=Phenylobacterium sp. TaxID=1871053 RepID=UPI002C513AD4|nr:DedA family protein [Phenylobacterium sp.]HVI34334.1 DedA family protein [Phenylobacterium sp.]
MFEWVVGVVVGAGLVGVALLMFGENLVPPIPSEVVMPLAGFAAAQGHLSFPGVVAAGTAGAVAGASFWYVVGRRIPEARLRAWVERHGRWLTIDTEELDRAQRAFARRGGWAVFLGRLIPGVRTFVSVPAGVVRMAWWRFLGWTALGTAVWTLFLAGAGYLLAAEYHLVERWMDPVSEVVLAGVVVLYVWRVARRRKPG